jgi:hypothetical protein
MAINTSVSTIINGLTEGYYTFKIWSIDSAGNESSTAPVLVKIDINAPDNDIVLEAVAADTDRVALTWNPSAVDSTDADSVAVWYKTTGYPDGMYDTGAVLIGKRSMSDSGITVSGLTMNMLYYFGLAVRDSSGNWSAVSATSRDTATTNDYSVPLNVSNFRAANIGGNVAVIRWNPSVSGGVDSVIVVYRVDGTYASERTAGTVIGRYGNADTVDTITGLTEKTIYRFSAFVKGRYNLWSISSTAARDSVFLPDITPPDTNVRLSLGSILDTAITVRVSTDSVAARDVKFIYTYYSYSAVIADTKQPGVVSASVLPFCADTSIVIGSLSHRGWWHVAVMLEDSSGLVSALKDDSILIYNNKPQFIMPDSVVALEDETWAYTLVAADADGDSLHFGLNTAALSGFTLNTTTGAMTWQPGNRNVGRYGLNVWVADARRDTVSATVNLIVRNVNDMPVIDSTAMADSVLEDSVWSASSYIHDPDAGDSIAVSWVMPVSWAKNLSVRKSSAGNDSAWVISFGGMPVPGDSGWHSFELKMADKAGAFVTLRDSVYVVHINRPPVVSIVSKRVLWGAAQYSVNAMDDRDTMFSYHASLSNVNDGAVAMQQTVTASRSGTTFRFFPLVDNRYVFRCYAMDSESLGSEQPAFDTFKVVNATTRTIAFSESSWHMISVPSAGYVAAPLKNDAYFAHWDEARAEDKIFKYYQAADGITATQPGNAYWRQGKDTVIVQLARDELLGGGISLELSKAKYGWNQIGSPYPYPVQWPGTEVLWKWNAAAGDFEQEPNNILYPWDGYFVLMDSSQAIPISNEPAFTATGVARRLHAQYVSRSEWQVQIRLFTGSGMDGDNIIGFSSEAENGRDLLDRPEPPRMAGQQYMYFSHPEWKYAVNEFASDVRRGFEDLNVFQIGVAPSAKSGVVPSIAFTGVAQLKDVYLFVVSVDSVWQAVEGVATLVSHSSKDAMYTTVFATADKNFLNKFPRQFAVHNPYPNPFRMNVALQYTLPYRWEKNGWFNKDAYSVSVTIYDARGRVVRSLLNRKQEPGSYKVVWDGKCNTGRSVAAGAYFFRLKAGKFEGVKKLMMVR